ncbi:hypothetical protein, partial [Klebsiella pneumoniae]|uniref:hypothetical protein n=1 Tax=Klebsiella pneumoniae TaxID=573 RepID=UPI0038BB96F2
MSDQARSAALLSVELGNLANDTDSAAAAAKRKASAMRSDTDATNANARATRRLASNLIALNGVPG